MFGWKVRAAAARETSTESCTAARLKEPGSIPGDLGCSQVTLTIHLQGVQRVQRVR